MFYFTPLRGFFSPFPHGTSSLSVTTEYLALEDGPPRFRQGFSCPALLTNNQRAQNISSTRLSRALVRLSSRLRLYDGFLTRFLRLRTRLIAVRPHTTQRRKAYT